MTTYKKTWKAQSSNFCLCRLFSNAYLSNMQKEKEVKTQDEDKWN